MCASCSFETSVTDFKRDGSLDLPDADPACSAASCSDGLKNCGESDVDCGGDCLGCEDGKSCGLVDDCLTGECVSNTCETMEGCSPVVNYRSIGTSTDALVEDGTAVIAAGSTSMTFSAALPSQRSVGGIGPGDEVQLGGETFYIVTRISDTEVTVQPSAEQQRSGSVTIRRAFNTVQAWESSRQGDLVGNNFREKGIAYKDGEFDEDTIVIDGSTTSPCNYAWLTAAGGHRHGGVAADSDTDNVIFNPDNDGHAFEISDDYFRASWLEVTDFTGDSSEAFRVNNTGFLLENSIIHDAQDSSVDGVHLKRNGIEIEIRNTLFYNLGRMAVAIQDCGGGGEGDNIRVRLQSSTVFNVSLTTDGKFDGGVGFSVCGGADNIIGSVIVATNSYVHTSAGSAFAVRSGGLFTGSDVSASHDESAPGVTTLHLVAPSDAFVSQSDPIDLHLKLGSPLIDQGTDLGQNFSNDIDATQRSAPWDIGADELNPPFTDPF